MPKSWLESLTSTQRAVYPFVRRGVKENLSIARIGSAARKGGLSISNSILSTMVSKERAIVEHVKSLTSLGPNRLPNPLKLPEALTRIKNKYSIEVMISAVSDSTGTKFPIHATISTSKLLTNSQIASAVDAIMSSRGERYGFEMDTFKVTGYMRAGDEGFGF